jgi:hypothetical protein
MFVAHSERFRKVSNRYPKVVAQAYDGDLERAASDTDEQVAAKVAAWEEAQGREARDWYAIGREERDEERVSYPDTICPTCGGTGRVLAESLGLPVSTPDTETICPTCHGPGRVLLIEEA